MSYKDRQTQLEYMREYQRKKRSGVNPTQFLNSEWRLRTAEDLRVTLEAVLHELLTSEADIIVKSRAAAQLLGVGIKILELTDIDARLDALERSVNDR